MDPIGNSRSILKDIKKLLGLADDNTDYDVDVVLWINSAFAHLRQLGIGPDTGFRIEDDTKKWSDYLGASETLSDQVKTYIYMKTRLVFDTPQGSGMKEAMENELAEQEYRLRVLWDEEKKNYGNET